MDEEDYESKSSDIENIPSTGEVTDYLMICFGIAMPIFVIYDILTSA